MRYRIPLSEGAQRFSIGLGDFQYQLSLIYREAVGGGWFLDLVRADGTDAIYGLPLVTGVDLLAQHQYKGFGHLYVELEGGSPRTPTYDDMGKTISLYWEDGNAD